MRAAEDASGSVTMTGRASDTNTYAGMVDEDYCVKRAYIVVCEDGGVNVISHFRREAVEDRCPESRSCCKRRSHHGGATYLCDAHARTGCVSENAAARGRAAKARRAAFIVEVVEEASTHAGSGRRRCGQRENYRTWRTPRLGDSGATPTQVTRICHFISRISVLVSLFCFHLSSPMY